MDSSLSQNLNNIELTNNSENTLLKMGDGIATIGISGDIKGPQVENPTVL